MIKAKIIDKKGEIFSGDYLYLERGCDKGDIQHLFIVLNKNGVGDSEIHLFGTKEEMGNFKESLNKELEDKKEKLKKVKE